MPSGSRVIEMMRRVLLPVLVGALLMAGTAAGAATPEEAAATAGDTGLFVEPGLDVDREAIASAVRAAGDAGARVMVVLLEGDPVGGAVAFADAVLDRVGDGTVLVLSATGEGAASLVFDRSALERALDAGFAAGGGDAGYVAAFVAALVPSADSPGAESGGIAGWVVLIVIVGGLVLVAWWAVRRRNVAAEKRRRRAVAEARAEIEPPSP